MVVLVPRLLGFTITPSKLALLIATRLEQAFLRRGDINRK